jgi:type II secretory pathway component GspD/PulD (secretin)
MLCPRHLRRRTRPDIAAVCLLPTLVLMVCTLSARAQAMPQAVPQSPGTAALPAGTLSPAPEKTQPETEDKTRPIVRYPQISAKQAREADDAYLDGARQVERKDLAAALLSFEHAVQLNPGNRDYVLALVVAKESRITELVQKAAQLRKAGDLNRSDALLDEARKLDPENTVVAQHFGTPVMPPARSPNAELHGDALSSSLGGPIELDALPGTKSFHLEADARTLLRNVYEAFGITPVFDDTVSPGARTQIDLDNVTFADATRVVLQITHNFAVPLQTKQVLLIKDSEDNRRQYQPQIEETVYLPGYSQEQMTDLANLARQVFDLKQVTASSTGGFMLLRGDEESLRLVNAVYADMLDGGTDVLFDIHLYEVDATKVRNLGVTLPQSASGYDLLTSAQNLINANQSLISQATASGLLTLNGTQAQNEISELAFLIGAGVSGATQFTNLLGTLGTFGGLPLLGISVASGASFTASLNSSDARILDEVQVRSGNGTPTNFRAGSRYPIETAQYSSGVSSSLASQLSGLNINGTSASALLKQYLGSTQTSIPQFQFEDLGITLKMTPHVLRGDEVNLALDLKIEALGGTSINSIPVLNNRALTSTVTIPAGQTAMMATLVSRNELKSVDGLPGLSELPGFQGTEQDREFDSSELLITITPHVVRPGAIRTTSRRLAAVHTASSQ